ncbi:MAG TPA: NrfD/PsrC family molybdoenzyme membrane anchor subunit [candidate division Zixibacteria bacterium]|nr:NrfD/PsrC family molybdoenzyme membrane anchor subunit [candidate division Zixibacteria bacterium]
MKLEKSIFWAAVIALVIGAYGIIIKLTTGNQEANIGSYIPWGLGVAGYAYLMGISAGSFLLSAIAYVFEIRSFEKIRRLGLIIALSTAIPGLILVFLDIGHPFRVFISAIHLNSSSVMSWLFILYPLYLIILLLMLWQTRYESRDVKKLAAAGIIVAIAFEIAGGALYGVVGARPFWNAGILPMMFLASSLLSGIAVVSFVAYVLHPEYLRDDVRTLGTAILLLIVLYGFLEFSDILSIYYSRIPADIASVNLLLFGPFAWVFWGFFVLGTLLIPALLLIFKKTETWALALASGLVAISSLSAKLNIVIPGLAVPELAGLESAFVHARLTFSYFPSMTEWLELIFALALATVLIMIGNRVLIEKRPIVSLFREAI